MSVQVDAVLTAAVSLLESHDAHVAGEGGGAHCCESLEMEQLRLALARFRIGTLQPLGKGVSTCVNAVMVGETLVACGQDAVAVNGLAMCPDCRQERRG
jgi:hypothetical protein